MGRPARREGEQWEEMAGGDAGEGEREKERNGGREGSWSGGERERECISSGDR